MRLASLLLAFPLLVIACANGNDASPQGCGDDTSATDPSESGKAKTGSKAGSGSGSGSSKDSDLGPQCEAYLTCCDEVASENAAMGASCDSVRENIQSAQDRGADASTYESSCKSGLATMKRAGYCE